jgi:hypothetical protein
MDKGGLEDHVQSELEWYGRVLDFTRVLLEKCEMMHHSASKGIHEDQAEAVDSTPRCACRYPEEPRDHREEMDHLSESEAEEVRVLRAELTASRLLNRTFESSVKRLTDGIERLEAAFGSLEAEREEMDAHWETAQALHRLKN